ncbi:uncharacterized protein LOC124951559 [Vespa velutina]|uniref:uncharacterized protein LOC124951559 n=1 Tax=Vespa velutina TaxID=202808 RepID=UPI001FB21087|nr:uncharacterized protein LOC124951559 [Vespa velutina]
MGKTILISSLLLSIVIAMVSSLDTAESRELHSPRHPPMKRSINVQADGRQPEFEIYLLKRPSRGNLAIGGENNPLVQTDNVDCQCKCGKKRNDGLFHDEILRYSDHPGQLRGKIINVPPNCAPNETYVGGRCRVVS